MSDFQIGLSGLRASQRALETIGNNIANAATEGYHRQRIELTPAQSDYVQGVAIGQGVVVEDVTRLVDQLLENEILKQRSANAQASRESSTLRSIETVMGALGDTNLGTSLEGFFTSLRGLTADPHNTIPQVDVISQAQGLASQFQTINSYFMTLDNGVLVEATDTVSKINALTTHVAELNREILDLSTRQGNVNNLMDQRDQAIAELSELAGVSTISRANNGVDVSIAGMFVVVGGQASRLELSATSETEMGVSIAGMNNFRTDLSGGKLGALMTIKNEHLNPVITEIDNLASNIISQVNQYHVQGVPGYNQETGAGGSFTQLNGWKMVSQDVADFDPSVTDGSIYVRVTNTVTGVITRTKVDIDAGTDTLATVAAKINAVTGVSASVINSALSISADSNYKFDFLPGALDSPTSYSGGWSGTSTPTVGGIYAGAADETYTFTVVGTGTVGVSSDLTLNVEDSAGNTIATLDIGHGYPTGTKLQLASDLGLDLSFAAGDLTDGQSFTVEAIASSDTSGLLASAGINTFFSGNDASSISLRQDIIDNPSLIAISMGPGMSDNENAKRIAQLANTKMVALDNMTATEYYNSTVTSIGHKVNIADMRQKSTEDIINGLLTERDSISGVDINEEAAQMLVFEQMFQAMAKYMATIKATMDEVMNIL